MKKIIGFIIILFTISVLSVFLYFNHQKNKFSENLQVSLTSYSKQLDKRKTSELAAIEKSLNKTIKDNLSNADSISINIKESSSYNQVDSIEVQISPESYDPSYEVYLTAKEGGKIVYDKNAYSRQVEQLSPLVKLFRELQLQVYPYQLTMKMSNNKDGEILNISSGHLSGVGIETILENSSYSNSFPVEFSISNKLE